MARAKKAQVYRLLDAEPGVWGVVRYGGDPDEFTALAHAWLMDHQWEIDGPVAVLPPEPCWYRMNPCPWSDEYGWTLGKPKGPGRGVWWGALLRTTEIGCRQCQHVIGHDAGCLNADVTGLVTLQFEGSRYGRMNPLHESWVHAVRRSGDGGTPGPTLCGIYRFAPELSWSVGGGVIRGDTRYTGCRRCGIAARRDFPGLEIGGRLELAAAFAGDNQVPLAANLTAELAVRRLPAMGAPVG